MGHLLDQAMVRTILEHATDHPWRLQGIGLLALRLDDRREFRLHVWDPDACVGDPPIHDHPYDFISTVIVGEVINTGYVEDPSGDPYCRERYAPTNDRDRRTDTVRLVATSTATLGPGDHYRQLAGDLHDSHQTAGTVTIIRCAWHDPPELTVCLRPGAPWVSGEARPATSEEIERITVAALDLFADDSAPAGVTS